MVTLRAQLQGLHNKLKRAVPSVFRKSTTLSQMVVAILPHRSGLKFRLQTRAHAAFLASKVELMMR